MKKYLLVIIIAVIALLLYRNETFFKTSYLDKIIIPKYSYFIKHDKKTLTTEEVCCENTIEIISLKKITALEKFRTKNIEKLKACYDESYFYDLKNNITYGQYEIKSNFLFSKIKISYSNKNICADEYVLNDNWLDIFKASTITDYNINYESIIAKLTNAKRLPLAGIIEFNDQYQVSYLNQNKGYSLYFTVYSDNVVGIIVLDANDAKKYAIYDIEEDAALFLKSL